MHIENAKVQIYSTMPEEVIRMDQKTTHEFIKSVIANAKWYEEDCKKLERGQRRYSTTLFEGLINVHLDYFSISETLCHYFQFRIYAIANNEIIPIVDDSKEYNYGMEKLEFMKNMVLEKLQTSLINTLKFANVFIEKYSN